MKNTLKLHNPIRINANTVSELSYDANEITAQMFAEADASKIRASASRSGNIASVAELDYSLHLYLGFAAIRAVNPDYETADLERIHGFDVMEVMRIGRNFTMKSGEPSNPDSFENASGTTQEPSIHP